MVSVEVTGGVRRAYFEQRLPIKEIVRTLSVSRATVRKIIRSQKTAFKYERGVQPAPKLGVAPGKCPAVVGLLDRHLDPCPG